MKYRGVFLTIGVPMLSLIAAVVIFFAFRLDRRSPLMSQEIPYLQCGHQAVLRCCQIFGVPVDTTYIERHLPNKEQGHSMLELAKLLEKIGLHTAGLHETRRTLSLEKLPCIAHLQSPNHYVVIVGIDEQYVHLFDGDGRRTARFWDEFSRQWDGNILMVKKPSSGKRLPAYLPEIQSRSPQISFDRLLTDLGTVPATGESVAFDFAFKNTGQDYLVIESLHPDCSCIKYEKPEAPIPPGATGVIKLFYQVQTQHGPFSHMVAVKTNDPQIPVVPLYATGWSGVDVRIEPSSLWLTPIVNRETSVVCFVKYTGDKGDITLNVSENALENISLKSFVSEKVNFTSRAKFLPEMPNRPDKYESIYLLHLTFQSEGEIGDEFKGDIFVETGIPEYEKFTIAVRGRVISPVQAFPKNICFSSTQKSDEQEQKVTLLSQEKEPFQILDVQSTSQNITVRFSKTESTVSEIFFRHSGDASEFDQTSRCIVFFRTRSSKEVFELPINVSIDQRENTTDER